MPYLLFCHLQKRAQWRTAVAVDSFTVGSSRRATVTVADPHIAPEAVAIRRRGDQFRIVNLADHKEVLLNGAPVVEATVTTGDRVRLGNTFMLFVADARPSGDAIDQLESILDREIFTPERVKEALEAEATSSRWNWRVLVAFASCGLAIGVLAAIVVARLAGR